MYVVELSHLPLPSIAAPGGSLLRLLLQNDKGHDRLNLRMRVGHLGRAVGWHDHAHCQLPSMAKLNDTASLSPPLADSSTE
jgi:hypothetical protein